MYPTNGADAVFTPSPELQAQLDSNAFRIADLRAQLEQSSAELRRLRGRLRGRAPCARRGAAKPPMRSPRSGHYAEARGHWSADEEKRFAEALAKHGPAAYSAIAADVGTRTEKQVRDHAWRMRQKNKAAADSERKADCERDAPRTPATPDVAYTGASTEATCKSPPPPEPLTPPAAWDELSMLGEDLVLDALWEEAPCDVTWNGGACGEALDGEGSDEMSIFGDLSLLGDRF